MGFSGIPLVRHPDVRTARRAMGKQSPWLYCVAVGSNSAFIDILRSGVEKKEQIFAQQVVEGYHLVALDLLYLLNTPMYRMHA